MTESKPLRDFCVATNVHIPLLAYISRIYSKINLVHKKKKKKHCSLCSGLFQFSDSTETFQYAEYNVALNPLMYQSIKYTTETHQEQWNENYIQSSFLDIS
jgi:hypothetical protein